MGLCLCDHFLLLFLCLWNAVSSSYIETKASNTLSTNIWIKREGESNVLDGDGACGTNIAWHTFILNHVRSWVKLFATKSSDLHLSDMKFKDYSVKVKSSCNLLTKSFVMITTRLNSLMIVINTRLINYNFINFVFRI